LFHVACDLFIALRADNVWLALNKETGSTLMDSSAQLTVFLAETPLPDENGATMLLLRVFNPRSVRPSLDPEGHYASRPKLTYWPAVRQFDTPAAIAEYLGPALENTTANFRLVADGMDATFVQHGQVMREKRLVVCATNKQRGCAALQRNGAAACFHSPALSFFFFFFFSVLACCVDFSSSSICFWMIRSGQMGRSGDPAHVDNQHRVRHHGLLADRGPRVHSGRSGHSWASLVGPRVIGPGLDWRHVS
jgi:hypothetical protein